MKRVHFLGHSGSRTGAPFVLLHLLRWLRENTDWTFELTLVEGGKLAREYAHICPTSTLLPGWLCGLASRFGRADLLARFERHRLLGLRSRLERQRTDLLYANTITLGRPTAELAGSVPAVITHVHEMSHWIERAGARNLELVRRNTSRFIAVSEAVRETLVERFGFEVKRVDVVHAFVPTRDIQRARGQADLRSGLGATADTFLVAGSGHETWRKGKDLFVELAAHVTATQVSRPFLFVWAGGWDAPEEERRIKRRIEELGLAAVVHFVGHMEDPLDFFSQANVFAMVSREDPFPLVCLEAAALGVPVLCFESSGGTPELVETDAGIIVPPLDVAAMASRLLELAADEPRRVRLGLRAAAKVRERFDVEQGARRIALIVESVSDAMRVE